MSEEQLSIFDDPTIQRRGLARSDGSRTQKEAAVRCAPNAATQRGRLLMLMHAAGDEGMTAIEAEIAMLGYFPMMRNVRARITELRRDGWLIFTGRIRTTETGFDAEVNLFNPVAEADYQRWRAEPSH